MKALPDEGEREKLVNGLLESLFRGQSYGERKGAAFGVAGCTSPLPPLFPFTRKNEF